VKVVDIARKALHDIEEHHREKDLFEGVMNLYSGLCGNCGSALAFMGGFHEGKAILEKGLQNAHELKDKLGIAWVEMCLSWVSFWEGDGTSTIDHSIKSAKCWEEAGIDPMQSLDLLLQAVGHYLLGDYERAREYAEKGFMLKGDYGAPVVQPLARWYLAIIHMALGDLIRARGNVEDALKLSQEYHTRSYEGLSLIVIGSIKGKLDTVHIDEAVDDIQHGLSILEELKARAFSALGYLFLGELHTDTCRKEEALENLKKAESLYLEMKVTPKSYWLKRTQEALAKLRLAP
jgi:tetratricopeptide (TPR) repeat protein